MTRCKCEGMYSDTYQAPTGILIGPLDDNSSRFTQPAVVLMKLSTWCERCNRVKLAKHLRLLQDVVLDFLLVPTVLEHTRQALHTPHTAPDA